MTALRFILHSLAFTGPGAETASLGFDDKVKFVYGASNTGKSFALAALDFMLGGSPKELPDFSQRDPYDTAWLSLILPGKGPITLSRALAGGSFGLWDGFVSSASGEPRAELDQKHSATKTDSLSHLLLDELGLTGKKIATNKSGHTDNLSFRQLAPFVLIDETAMFATGSAFGLRLRKVRVSHKMSQSDFGKLFGRSKQCISSWESGRAEMTSQQLVQLSRMFFCDLHWLLTGHERDIPQKAHEH